MSAKSVSPSEGQAGKSRIIGLRLPIAMAKDVKSEAARRGIPLNRLFRELWELYKKNKKGKV